MRLATATRHIADNESLKGQVISQQEKITRLEEELRQARKEVRSLHETNRQLTHALHRHAA